MTNSKFIKIGDQRIRLSNIKSYGIKKVQIIMPNEAFVFGRKVFFPPDKCIEERAVLYIETYQGDTHNFYENDLNIREIVSEIDKEISLGQGNF